MKNLARISLLLVILLVSLSAYLRLSHSGIGCADWPACYGRIGDTPAVTLPAEEAYKRIVEAGDQPLSWATPLHRLVASVLGLLVLAMAFMSLRERRQRLASFALLALTVYLAVIGIRSGSLHDPAVVMGNLAGGFAMLGMLGWMVFAPDGTGGGHRTVLALAAGATVLLSLQILLGGLTSANFAATSCQTLPDCHGGWWPGGALMDAMDLNREHQITSTGQAIGGEERIAIHRAHRLGALVTLPITLLVAFYALRTDTRYRVTAVIILILASAEFGVGVSSVLTGLPIGLAVAHNWFAALLLLALLRLLAQAR